MEDGQGDAQFALVPKQARESNPTAIGSSNIRITFPGTVVEIGESASEAQIRFTLEVLLNVQ
jgi:ADP-ribose pyrophosphatase YjhB (NUDIX family)